MLYNEKNYTMNLGYLFNHYIREYDISKANINVLLAKGVINQNLYTKLYYADRMERQVYIGKMIKNNPNIQEVLNAGIIEYKQKFFETNGITDSDIISIKNDAVFILNKMPQILNFDNVTFVHKNTYTSFMKINELEFYYGADMNNEVIDIKGIKDADLEIYHFEFLNIIIDFFRYIQKSGPEITLQYITSVINDYVNLKLPINVYRRFRSSNDFVINGFTDDYGIMSIEDNEYNRNAIDISYNLNILRIMHMYASQVLYEEKMRK
jgi:predicted SnoaL-like aldol condensation-catalyzing enzyme